MAIDSAKLPYTLAHIHTIKGRVNTPANTHTQMLTHDRDCSQHVEVSCWVPAGVKLSGPHIHRAQCLRGNDKRAAPHKDKQQRLTHSAETRWNSTQPEAMSAKKHYCIHDLCNTSSFALAAEICLVESVGIFSSVSCVVLHYITRPHALDTRANLSDKLSRVKKRQLDAFKGTAP